MLASAGAFERRSGLQFRLQNTQGEAEIAPRGRMSTVTITEEHRLHEESMLPDHLIRAQPGEKAKPYSGKYNPMRKVGFNPRTGALIFSSADWQEWLFLCP